MLRAVPVVLWLGALVMGAPIPAFGQMELAVIKGIVKDDAGKPIEGVTFRLHDPGRGRDYEIKSDKNGRFYRRGLAAVEYELTVEKDGYQPIHDKVKLSAGIDRSLTFTLVKAAPAGAEEFQKGVEAFNRGDNEAAVRAFEEAAARAPDAPEVHVNLALAYLRVSRHDDAIAHLERAASLAPDQPRVLFQLGGAYVDARRYEKAIEALEKGLALQPDLSDPNAYEATVTLGAVYFAAGRNAEAIKRFEKAIAAQPAAPAPKLGLAKAYFSEGNVDKALELFKEIVKASPGTPEAAEAEAFIKELEKGSHDSTLEGVEAAWRATPEVKRVFAVTGAD